jgi:phenylacetate-CoA ligase
MARGLSAAILALLRELEQSQWLSPKEIAEAQHRQLMLLARHAARHSALIAERLRGAGLDPQDLASPEGLARLPLLTRRDMQRRAEDLFCREVPEAHRPVGQAQTSGATGEPVAVRRTMVSRMIFWAMNLRDHVWHGRDPAERFSSIRPQVPAYAVHKDWGPPWASLLETGRLQAIPMALEASRQVELLREFKPYGLIVYPNSLDAILAHCESSGMGIPGLAKIRTISETLSPRIRLRSKTVLGIAPADHYSSQEVGSIAIECPESGLYHVMAESVILEVVDDQGRPCREGEAGRVLLTDLHNFAMPILRYEIGDYAEPGGACPCGRGLPTLRRILGRERNLVLMPDGSRHWPLVGFHQYREIAPVNQ